MKCEGDNTKIEFANNATEKLIPFGKARSSSYTMKYKVIPIIKQS